jgi:hypothetical protein
MGCVKCGASRMTEQPPRRIGEVYVVKVFDCPRCGSVAKEIIASNISTPLLVLASHMTSTPTPIR